MSSKRKAAPESDSDDVASEAGSSGAARAPTGTASLYNASIATFRLEELESNPVFFIHAPQGYGATTLIGSLLIQLQCTRGLDGVCVLADRAPKYYMGGILSNPDVLAF